MRDRTFPLYKRIPLYTNLYKQITQTNPAIGGSASPASLGVEMITHFDAETALRCGQMK